MRGEAAKLDRETYYNAPVKNLIGQQVAVGEQVNPYITLENRPTHQPASVGGRFSPAVPYPPVGELAGHTTQIRLQN